MQDSCQIWQQWAFMDVLVEGEMLYEEAQSVPLGLAGWGVEEALVIQMG